MLLKWEQLADCLEIQLAPIGVSNWDVQGLNPSSAIKL